MDRSDPEEARYIALGQRNAEVIELFQRFCGNVRVQLMGGTGMLEAATGLPIGQRAFRCAYASGGIASGMVLEDLAVEFYEEHCRGCADRARSGLLGDTIATLADARRSDQEARAGRETAAAAERQRQRDERAARRSRRSAGEPYQSATQLEYVDRLDAADGSPEAADVEWLVRTASLGPEVISDATVAELVELASDLQVPWGTREAAQAVLVPLTTAGRVLATQRRRSPSRTSPRALDRRPASSWSPRRNAVPPTPSPPGSPAPPWNLPDGQSDPVARVMSRFTGERSSLTRRRSCCAPRGTWRRFCGRSSRCFQCRSCRQSAGGTCRPRRAASRVTRYRTRPPGRGRPVPEHRRRGLPAPDRGYAGAVPRLVTRWRGHSNPGPGQVRRPAEQAVGRTLGHGSPAAYNDVAPSFLKRRTGSPGKRGRALRGSAAALHAGAEDESPDCRAPPYPARG